MDEVPVDDRAPVAPPADTPAPLREALCVEELAMITEQCAMALGSAVDQLIPATGLILIQAQCALAGALFTTLRAVSMTLLTLPEDAPDKVEASAKIANARQSLLDNLQVLYHFIQQTGERPRIVTPKSTIH